jgi:hypothetical protein
MRIKASLIPCQKETFYGDSLASGRSLLTIIIQIKNELTYIMNIQNQNISVDGQTIFYREVGNKEKTPTILLLHEF